MSSHLPSASNKNTFPKRLRQRASRGVTLVELIVCVSLLAILVGLAVPSFSGLLSDWRRDSAISNFTGDLQLARATALRTSRPVVMCATLDGMACANGAASSDWRQGWIVFSDLDGNRALGNAEPVIVFRGPLMGLQQMQSNIPLGQIEFRPNGLLRRGNATVNVLTEGAGAQRGMSVVINATGRVSLL